MEKCGKSKRKVWTSIKVEQLVEKQIEKQEKSEMWEKSLEKSEK